MLICPICETKVNAEDFTEIYTSPFNNQEYKKYECPNCDIHWWEPLKMIPEFYENGLFSIGYHLKQRRKLARWHKPFFSLFPKSVCGMLLDIGCGDGVFLREARKEGFEVFGIDFDRRSVETAKKYLQIDTIYAMSLEEFFKYAEIQNLKFDVITFFEVLEHQDDPKNFLKIVKKLLKPNGYIAGSVPNRDSYFTIKQHEKRVVSPIDLPPHHFLRFSKKALINALEILSFKDIQVVETDFSIKEVPSFIRRTYLKRFEALKNKIKSRVTYKQDIIHTTPLEDIVKLQNSNISKLLLGLKKIELLLFLPITLIYIPKLRRNGYSLYFQARIIS